MPRVCTVCAYADRHAIDTALVAGEPMPRLAALHRVSEDALLRHRANHLPKLLAQARDRDTERETTRATALAEQADRQAAAEVAHALDVVRQLKAINGASLAVLNEARQTRDGDLALKAIDRIQRQIELQAKLLGDLDERPVVNVLVAPEWLTVRGRLIEALSPYPEARVAVAGAVAALGAGDGAR